MLALLAVFWVVAMVRCLDLDIDPQQPVFIGENSDSGMFGDHFQKDLEINGVPVIQIRKDSSEGLSEFTPIRATIGQSEIQYYSFNVNSSSGIAQYYESIIFITGNICSQPDNIEVNDTSLVVYYSFNSSMFQNNALGQMSEFDYGYFLAFADVQSLGDEDLVLYIAVRAPENTDASSSWLYEIGVSQNNLVFQWDDRSWASLVDTDDTSALIVTGNLTDSGNFNESDNDYNISRSRYSLYLYSEEYKNFFALLNNSWCAVRNGPALEDYTSESTFTSRGGGWQQQFYVEGLNSSTTYIAYLISDFRGTDFGGAVYQRFEFETMNNEACSLIYDLEFCDQVAYLVPNNQDFTSKELKQLYDDRAKTLYTNFSYAMDQILCDTSQASIFSPFRSCDDCKESYKNWLCAVTIPRCSTRNITGYQHVNYGDSRNDWINDNVGPELAYYEVLPCLNVCEAIVRDCPSDFGFACPRHNTSVSLSYYWEDSDEKYPTCNFVGRTAVASSMAIRVAVNFVVVAISAAMMLL